MINTYEMVAAWVEAKYCKRGRNDALEWSDGEENTVNQLNQTVGSKWIEEIGNMKVETGNYVGREGALKSTKNEWRMTKRIDRPLRFWRQSPRIPQARSFEPLEELPENTLNLNTIVFFMHFRRYCTKAVHERNNIVFFSSERLCANYISVRWLLGSIAQDFPEKKHLK